MSEEKGKYLIGVDFDMEIAKRKDDLIKQVTLSILDGLDDIDKQSVVMWSDEDHPNVVRIKVMTKAMRDEIEKMIYDSIPER